MLASTRAHNDANILALGARFISTEEAKDAVIKWLEVAFSGDERHVRRIAKFN
jgi:ribose 5-phosphate isomerase B